MENYLFGLISIFFCSPEKETYTTFDGENVKIYFFENFSLLGYNTYLVRFLELDTYYN